MFVSTNPGNEDCKNTGGSSVGVSLQKVFADPHALIVIIYVDDVLIYARDSKDIGALILKLKKEDIILRREGTAEGYLGIKVKQEDEKQYSHNQA